MGWAFAVALIAILINLVFASLMNAVAVSCIRRSPAAAGAVVNGISAVTAAAV